MLDIVSFFVSSSEPRVGGGGGEVVKPVTTGDPNQILTSDSGDSGDTDTLTPPSPEPWARTWSP